ncbi:MAG TPA: tetratricopeptide repeat protein [Edaphocola sp.]|nr:tetratricopeptide repeat protein [Edaphocola sp.]
MILPLLMLLTPSPGLWAQQVLSPEIQRMQQSAQQSLQQKDYANSIMLLNQAIRQAPDNVSLRRDLAYTYYLSGKADEARKIIEPVVQSEFADEQTFQIAAAIENVSGKFGRARRILKDGIRKFPHSGLLYSSMGNLYSMEKSDQSALDAWMTGIRSDPGYGANYYGAARMFNSKGNYVWALIYGEIFLNLDQDPFKGNQIKKMMISAYQAILSEGSADLPSFRGDNGQKQGKIVSFEDCYKKVLQDNALAIRSGFNTETLTMLRTRFLMEWQMSYARRFPFTLFTWQGKLIQAGYFDAYNQWLFGAVNNSQAFQLWVKKFADNYGDFEKWDKGHPLQPASYDPQPE